MPRRKKPAWTWADYECQHGPRPTAEMIAEPSSCQKQTDAVAMAVPSVCQGQTTTTSTFDRDRAAAITSHMMGDPPPDRSALGK